MVSRGVRVPRFAVTTCITSQQAQSPSWIVLFAVRIVSILDLIRFTPVKVEIETKDKESAEQDLAWNLQPRK
jgi:hypothetical protein